MELVCQGRPVVFHSVDARISRTPHQPFDPERLAGLKLLSLDTDGVLTDGRLYYGPDGEALKVFNTLDGHGLKKFFQGFAFSDEVGYSKPHADMFLSAARQLGVDVEEMIHIGDRDHNDIKGAQALGMKAVLFTAARDDDKDTTSADAICERHADLPGIIDGLAS